ncbi:hypothetical protein PRECH8_27530 [Insulibacter thermoxylanivorax]|uniref:DJ-1/PfpI domain-containing protein n=1 Tax=Insulibacter thermoxylanivorax TaxID=2749268 RepID=A0A916VGI6_9BACL|nr:type 1 glutamine amidotransferase domain-containing protein [Insulibacter thermoxylanivorax]GFR39457.1 hypothetical protein PRECH8_27530 [Insulibacter thermoxylanivorax]
MSQSNKILMVVTSHSSIDEDHPTGIWLSEFAEPYNLFVQAGYTIDVASVQGGKAPIDPRSLSANKEEWKEAVERLNETLLVRELDGIDEYAALFLPGGHGTMFDLPDDEHLQRLIAEFAESGRVVAAVCHGPAALVNITLKNGEPYVKGKRLTSFTDDEERAAKFDTLMPFLLESRLRELGAEFIHAPLWENHVEVDGTLVTGQNPQSSEAAAQKVLELLKG